MGEDSYFNSLYQIMWDMEIDIFSEKERTLALLADIVPKCRKQRKRLEAMYNCGAMDLIEKGIADRCHYEQNMKKAVRILIEEMNLSSEKALFSVNQIAGLWDEELYPITEYDGNEELDYDEEEPQSAGEPQAGELLQSAEDSQPAEHLQSAEGSQNEEQPPEPLLESGIIPSENQGGNSDSVQANETEHSDEETDNPNENNNDKDGEENMIFLQDVAAEENTEAQEEQPAEAPQEEQQGGGEEQPQPPPPRESIAKKIAQFWCKSDFEDGRPSMAACPMGWLILLICAALGGFMIYDIPLGDKFVVPTFAFMFSVLTSKRLYRFESTARFSFLVGACYLAAMGRVIWLGKGYPPIACVPMVIAALIVFNSGRIGTLLDESKKNSFFAYLLIIFFSAAVTVGAYAIQQVEF